MPDLRAQFNICESYSRLSRECTKALVRDMLIALARRRVMKRTGDRPWSVLRRCLRGDVGSAQSPQVDIASCADLGQVAGLLVEAQPVYLDSLSDACEKAALQAMVLGLAEERLASWLNAAGITRWVALKGTASSKMLYSDPALRQRSDIDLLISPDQMEAVAHCLEAEGLEEKTAAQHWAAADSMPYQRTWDMTISSMIVEVDVHRRLLRWEELTIDHDGVLDRAVRREGSVLPLCAPEDLLLHTLAHAANEAFRVPLRSWIDVVRLIHYPTLDWSAVVHRASTWRLQPVIWAGLEVARRWFDAAPPAGVLSALRPSAAQAFCLRRLTSSAGQHPCEIESALGRGAFRMLCRVNPQDAIMQARQAVAIRTALHLSR